MKEESPSGPLLHLRQRLAELKDLQVTTNSLYRTQGKDGVVAYLARHWNSRPRVAGEAVLIGNYRVTFGDDGVFLASQTNGIVNAIRRQHRDDR